MAMDMSFLLARDWKLPEIDVYGPYKQALTLRQLTDEREYRRMQMRALDLKAQQEAREEREREAFKVAVAQGEDPEKLISVHPELAYSLITKKAAARTQQRLETAAEAEAQAKKTEQQRKINQAVANIGMQAAQIQDPAEREGYFNTQLAGTLIDAGITPAEQFGAFPVPQNQRAAERYFASVNGPDELRKYKAAVEEDARKEALFGPQYAKAVAEKTASQQKITGTEPIQPAQQAQLDKDPASVQEFNQVFKPGWLQQRQLSDNPVNSYRAWLDYQQAKTPQLYTSEEEAQRVRMAKATQEGKPATAAENEAYGFYRRVTDAEQTLGTMEEHMKNMGMFGQAWYNLAPNWAQSDENQVVRQAQRQFTEARLRKESGAAIPPHEYENDAKTYFPQPGDSEAIRLRKKKARETLIGTLRKQAGRALAGEPEIPAGAGTAGAGVPKVGDTFQGSRVKSVTKVK